MRVSQNIFVRFEALKIYIKILSTLGFKMAIHVTVVTMTLSSYQYQRENATDLVLEMQTKCVVLYGGSMFMQRIQFMVTSLSLTAVSILNGCCDLVNRIRTH